MPSDTLPPPRAGKALRSVLVVVALVAAAVAVTGILGRSRNHAELERWATEHAVPHVSVVLPQRRTEATVITLPGRLRAYYHAPIHPRVNGYISRLAVDIGAVVKEGDLLAEIDTPELDQQLLQARADLSLARANAELSRTTAARWESMLKTHSVARQAVDEKRADLAAREASVKAAQAAVERLLANKAFARIVAPFDGTVTARLAETGALVNAGATEGRALFEVSDTRRLRLYVNVPQMHVNAVAEGAEAVITVPERPGQRYAGKVESASGAVDAASGTSLMQIIIDNTTGDLLPGGFASVSFGVPAPEGALTVPASALVFDRSGLRVATVGEGNAVTMKTVTLLGDLGARVVIGSGLSPTDRVIENPPDGIADGALVAPASP
jgi:RND family efflux transporter MFP subunit